MILKIDKALTESHKYQGDNIYERDDGKFEVITDDDSESRTFDSYQDAWDYLDSLEMSSEYYDYEQAEATVNDILAYCKLSYYNPDIEIETDIVNKGNVLAEITITIDTTMINYEPLAHRNARTDQNPSLRKNSPNQIKQCLVGLNSILRTGKTPTGQDPKSTSPVRESQPLSVEYEGDTQENGKTICYLTVYYV